MADDLLPALCLFTRIVKTAIMLKIETATATTRLSPVQIVFVWLVLVTVGCVKVELEGLVVLCVAEGVANRSVITAAVVSFLPRLPNPKIFSTVASKEK